MKRSLGQNFLVDGNTIQRIVAAGAPAPGDQVLEIGGGAGALTASLVASGAAVTVVETDAEWVGRLQDRFAGEARVRILHADATKIDLDALTSTRGRLLVYGNLPYNRAVPITMRLLGALPRAEQMVLMFQKEVADRIASAPGGRSFGSLPLKVAPLAAVERLFHVKPTCFRPRPRVMSTVLRFRPHQPPWLDDAALPRFVRLVDGAFRSRRKTLPNAIRIGDPASASAVDAELAARDVSPRTRPEQLGYEFYRGVLERLLGGAG
jgi:16S rRNA (adenine1518-N6/adenine1519-N6)-dimethyltransferase